MKYRGEWHFSNEGANSYYGYLEFDKGTDIILEIIDNRDPMNSKYRAGQTGLDIYGRLENDEKVTLRDCTILSANPFLDNFRLIRIEALYSLIGEQYHEGESQFDSVVVSYSNLNSFISYNSLIYDSLRIQNNHTNTFERELEISGVCRLRIFPELSSLASDTKILFEIESHNNKSLNHYLKLSGILQDFLNFITSSEVLIEKVDAINNLGTFNVNYHSTRPIQQKKNKSVLFKPHCKSILFHYSTISPRLVSILGKWFELSSDLKQVYDLYFAVVFHIDQYDVYRFLMLSTALEVYHALILDPGSEIKKKKLPHYEKLISKISGAQGVFEKREAEELISVLKYRSELSFEERLKEIYCYFREIVSRYCKFKEINSAVKSTVDTRNYYVHYDPEKEGNALEGTDLLYLTKDLQFLLQLCFLTRIGFEKDEINHMFLNGIP